MQQTRTEKTKIKTPDSIRHMMAGMRHNKFFRLVSIHHMHKQKETRPITAEMDDDNTVYQWRRKYVRKNQSNLVPTLTANMGEGGHNVPLIKTDYGIRKLKPIECFYAQGFPKNYKLPSDMSDSRLYKQAGNSVAVPVIERIAEKIIYALDNTD